MCVDGGIEAVQEGEHFGRVATAAEDDEEVGRCAALSGWGARAVGAGKNVDETEL